MAQSAERSRSLSRLPSPPFIVIYFRDLMTSLVQRNWDKQTTSSVTGEGANGAV